MPRGVVCEAGQRVYSAETHCFGVFSELAASLGT